MKNSFHARHQIEERFGFNVIKTIKKKIRNRDYKDLPGIGNTIFSLIVIENKDPLVIVRDGLAIITVITLKQYLQRRNYLVEETIRDRLSSLCQGIEREGKSLSVKLKNLTQVKI